MALMNLKVWLRSNVKQHTRHLNGTTFTITSEEPHFWKVSIKGITIGFYRVNVITGDVSAYSHQRYLIGIMTANFDVIDKIYEHYRVQCGRL